jgi:teichuronic acid biosynthesis glycosyltransferase TuaC
MSSQLRVLCVTAAYPTPGSHKGAFLQSEVEGLREQGIDVTVLHLQGQMKYVQGARQVLQAAQSGNYDIVHGHYSFCGMVARSQRMLPVVITFWGSDVLKNPVLPDTRAGSLSRALSPRLARMADACIVPSQEMADALKGANVTIVQQGINFAKFRPVDQMEARRQLGLNPDPDFRYILFCNNPALPVKGYPIAEQAVALMQQQGAPVEMVVANGLTHEQVVLYMNACDLLTLPSYWEGGPYVVKEAMACNLPIVATDVGDVATVIANTAGCLIADLTPDDFARKMWKSLHTVRRTTGRQDIAHLSREHATQRVITVYEHVMQKHHKATATGS